MLHRQKFASYARTSHVQIKVCMHTCAHLHLTNCQGTLLRLISISFFRTFTFMKAIENPPPNLMRQGELEKQFVLKMNVKGHHLWSHLQVQGKKEEILDSLSPKRKQKFEEKAKKKNSNNGTVLRIKNMRSLSEAEREKLPEI